MNLCSLSVGSSVLKISDIPRSYLQVTSFRQLHNKKTSTWNYHPLFVFLKKKKRKKMIVLFEEIRRWREYGYVF